MTYSNIVICGGGIYGISYLGLLNKLEEEGKLINVQEYAGTSIGSLISILLSLDIKSNEIYEMLKSNKLVDKKDIKIKTLLNKYGLDSGERFMKVIDEKLTEITKIKNITFLELYKLTNKKVTITGVDVYKRDIKYFNYITTPETTVVESIRISCSIPFIFTPYEMEGSLYIDGGLLMNEPISQVDVTKSTLVLRTVFKVNMIENIIDYIIVICSLIMKNKENKSNTIEYINIPYISSIPFFTYDYYEHMEKLYDMGYNYLKTCIIDKQNG